MLEEWLKSTKLVGECDETSDSTGNSYLLPCKVLANINDFWETMKGEIIRNLGVFDNHMKEITNGVNAGK